MLHTLLIFGEYQDFQSCDALTPYLKLGGCGVVLLKAMRWLAAFSRLFRTPVLTRQRVWLAFVVALVADGLQLLLGPLGWLVFDEVVDLLAMGLTCWLLGFHPLLLPTFVLEIIPVVDMLPTWTGCVAVVVALRKRQQSTVVEPPPALPPS